MNSMDQPSLPAAVGALVDNHGQPGLGPAERSGCLGASEVETRLAMAFSSLKVASPAQRLIRCAVLLWHDHLDAAHNIAQEIETPDGSWLHGIMHRREPDYWNAKYWFRRVGSHPAADHLGRHVGAVLAGQNSGLMAARLAPGGKWDHFAFVDWCEQIAARTADPAQRTALAVQALEIRSLLAHFAGA